MSRDEVQFDEVCRRINEFGDRAALITVTDSNTPHVVSALIRISDDRLLARVGPRTCANLLARSTLSLLWSPPAGGNYQLILDCVAEQINDTDAHGVTEISIAVDGGILHRLAELSGDGPTCIVLAAT